MVSANANFHINIKGSDRCLFIGRTGSGKTTLAKAILNSSNVERYTVIDPKHMFTPAKGVSIVPEYVSYYKKQVIRNSQGNIVEEDAYRNALLQAWRRKNCIIYVDEATLVTRPRPILPEYGRVIRTGRERNVGIWSATQRPADIPSVLFTECEHIFCFQLTFDDDRKKVIRFTGDKAGKILRGLRGHDFCYYNVLDDECTKLSLTL